jgi:hypothetical protein
MDNWRGMLRQFLVQMGVLVAYSAVDQAIRTLVNEKVKRRMAVKSRGSSTDTTLNVN